MLEIDEALVRSAEGDREPENAAPEGKADVEIARISDCESDRHRLRSISCSPAARRTAVDRIKAS
jgi:hypothetical protein